MQTQFVEKYVNPFTDFGFKKLFGNEANKDLQLDFLNQLRNYENSLKYYRDLKNSLDTAFDEGLEKGLEIGKLQIAQQMHAMGLDFTVISQATGLEVADIQTIIQGKIEWW